ncbi:MAG: zinc-dependent metalloprotease, partial [Deltaproteobacteria bacterium]|nr:zinc-dependent metalloprotease [Deltaproteobacteria bacterium]
MVNNYMQPDPWTCYYEYEFTDVFYNPNYCGAGEVRVRHAFTRVDDNNYQALYYPDSVTLTDAGGNEIYDPTTGEVLREPIFDRFGAYRLEKLTYDDERGLTESGRLYRAFRFDIWQQGRNANGPIPYEDRQAKPIVHHLNYDFPDDLKATAAEVAAEWNVAFQKTVASLQNLPTDNFVCPRTAGGAPVDANDPDCRLPNVFVLKENSCNLINLRNYLNGHGSVREQVIDSLSGDLSGSVVNRLLGSGSVEEDTRQQYLDNLCAAAEYHSQDLSDPFTWQQIGDPRFTMMYWVPNIVPTGWSGYGPMLADPVTGRVVTATAYIMGWTIESAATRALEYIDYINGDLSLSDLLLGTNAPNVIFQSQYDPTFYTQDMQDVRQMAEGSVDLDHLQGLKARMQSLGGSAGERLTPVENSAHFSERLNRIRGTEAERNFLIRPEDLMLASRGAWKTGDAVPEELWADASFVTRVREMKGKRDKVDRLFQERTMCPAAELDDALEGLAKCMKEGTCVSYTDCTGASDELLCRRDVRREYLRKAIFKAVMLHEVGHNVGMRHNFAASYDALNYPRYFWTVEAAYPDHNDPQQVQERLDAQPP